MASRTLLETFVILPLFACATSLTAQQASSRVTVEVTAEDQPLPSAEVRARGQLALTGPAGRATLALPAGTSRVLVWKVGFSVDTLVLELRPGADTTVLSRLSPVAQEIEPIVVRATRVETRIEEAPERVEVLAPEDVGEKSLSRPGDMTNLLVEMGGLHIQPVAPGLGGLDLRVQGLPGRYTLVLSDGLPLFGAQPPSFSLAQMPPLDLRQVEVIKGAATALYGASALGGVVDLVSRVPANARQVLLSQTTRSGTDGLLWLSRRISDRWGYTLLGGAHRQAVRDVGGDGWADIPGYSRAEARPRLFWTGPNGSSLLVTAGGIAEDRTGGTLPGAATPEGGPFSEKLDTRHLDAGAIGRLAVGPSAFLGLRLSAMATRHDRTFGAASERVRRGTEFGEATFSIAGRRHQAVIGASAERDAFRASPESGFDFGYTTTSLFGQDTYTPLAALSLEASGRLDHHSRYGTFASPRVSALLRLPWSWTLRASGGRGFFAPSPVPSEAEETGLSRVVPPVALRAERGSSGSLDLGGTFGPVQVNATAFVTRVQGPVLVQPLPPDPQLYTLANAPGPMRTGGAELFAVYAHDPLLVTATFSRSVATEYSLEESRRVVLPLTPRNAGGIDIAWEEEEPGESGFRAALEVFYTGRQRVEDDPYRQWSRPFTTVEVLLSQRLGRFLLFANGENLTGVRQTRWDPLLLPHAGLGGRWTTDEWAPLEGRIANVGIRASF